MQNEQTVGIRKIIKVSCKYLCSKFVFGEIHQFEVLARTLNLKLRMRWSVMILSQDLRINRILCTLSLCKFYFNISVIFSFSV